ncbi:MAG: PAS domain-containing sensor histidine kinase [Hyphomicrobiales bacterium]|nr:PAS domain-containing sensor histidine kinase [Hyphomicrobiales bacterium]
MSVETPSLLSSPLSRRTFEISRIVRTVGYVGVVLALVVAAVTFFILMGLTPIAPTATVVPIVLAANGGLMLFLLLIIGWEIAVLVSARRRRRAAARLHIRIVALFSVVAATPAILVAIVASVTLDRGLDNWFSTSTRAIVDNTETIARAFIDQQVDLIDRDIISLQGELERARPLLIDDPDRFQAFFSVNAERRGLPGAFLVDSQGEIVSEARLGSQAKFPPPPPSAIERAATDRSQPALITPGSINMVGGVVMLEAYDDVFLYALRPIPAAVLRQVALAADSIQQYNALESTRLGIQLAFGILYLGVALVVLLAAIWLGISFANRLVAPIRRLIDAAKQVSTGNLSVRVPAKRSEGDLGSLSETFNTMTSQLRTQREELLAANEQIDSRRRFTEAVLSGVTAGVIGVDGDERITIANRTTQRMLGLGGEPVENRPIAEVVPELGSVVAAATKGERPEHRDQIAFTRGGRERTINVRVTTEDPSDRSRGYVVTLDDITDLVVAQRTSAWADVARRIAHEIKNPLTPIQLSAERLRRRFGKAITEDREIFDQCTDTIVRQVGDIGRMVDEFSSFARMPKPTIERRNLSDSIREAVFLLEVAHPEITFTVDVPDTPLSGDLDARLMSQAFANVVKNGTEAIAALPPEERGDGRISISGRQEGDWIVVDVVDTGIGLPKENRHRILEPYMTTREKGTGLGLAIVKKIIEEHGGRIELFDAPQVQSGGHGALVRIRIPAASSVTPEPVGADQASVQG